MNQAHLDYLGSDDWKDRLEADLVPWIERVADLGDDVLEIGPGPGLTTDILRARTAHVTAVELDDALAAALAERLAGTNVEVVHADAATVDLPHSRYSAATCFSVLHHVPTPGKQDEVFAAIRRMLRPGAALFAVDARDIDFIREVHVDDTFVPLDEHTLTDRLLAAGFADCELEVGEYELRFVARTSGAT
jgi:SAM-dependent methyltransferase